MTETDKKARGRAPRADQSDLQQLVYTTANRVADSENAIERLEAVVRDLREHAESVREQIRRLALDKADRRVAPTTERDFLLRCNYPMKHGSFCKCFKKRSERWCVRHVAATARRGPHTPEPQPSTPAVDLSFSPSKLFS